MSATWQIDSLAPATPTVPSPPVEWLNSKSTSIAFAGESGGAFLCSVDGAAFTSCTSPKSFTVTGDGLHSFAVKQVDAATNVSPARTVIWNVDTSAPAQPGSAERRPSEPVPLKQHSHSRRKTPSHNSSVRFDNAAYEDCSSPYTRTGLADGTHNLKVKQSDRAGNVSTVRSSPVWTVDTTAPGAPQISGAPSGLTSSTAESIAFTGEAGGTFECRLDSGAWADCTSPKSLTALSDGPHHFSVRQRDQVDNVGPASTASWEVDSDAAPPALTNVPPALTQSGSASISFTGKPGASFSCSLDDGAFAPCSSPLELTGLADGEHKVKVRQTDLAGNTSSPSTVAWTRDSTAPAAPTVTAPKNIVHPVRNHSLIFTGEAGGSFECRKDGGAWGACVSPAAANFTSDGTHTLDVRQTDAAGNVGPPGTATWRIDTVAPAAPSLSGAPVGTVRSNSATLSVQGEAAPTTVQCRLNGGSWSPCLSPWELTGLGQGSQQAEARQTDAAGNVSPIGSVTWAVDTLAPALTKVNGKKKKRKTNLRSKFDASKGQPKSLEFSVSARKPSASAVPKKVKVRGWKPKIVIKGKKKIRWVRVSDEIGNQSPWYRVR
ncbi:MAG: hypothetical protein IPK93_06500 [Solirubrobacterales bacterium]|nr:hypothetical protein [Solirubrobacterales bacterium]